MTIYIDLQWVVNAWNFFASHWWQILLPLSYLPGIWTARKFGDSTWHDGPPSLVVFLFSPAVVPITLAIYGVVPPIAKLCKMLDNAIRVGLDKK